MNPIVQVGAALAALTALIIASIAAKVQVLPDVIDFTLVGTLTGYGGLMFTFYGAMRRYDPDRLGRLAMLGQLIGATLGVLVLVIGLIAS